MRFVLGTLWRFVVLIELTFRRADFERAAETFPNSLAVLLTDPDDFRLAYKTNSDFKIVARDGEVCASRHALFLSVSEQKRLSSFLFCNSHACRPTTFDNSSTRQLSRTRRCHLSTRFRNLAFAFSNLLSHLSTRIQSARTPIRQATLGRFAMLTRCSKRPSY